MSAPTPAPSRDASACPGAHPAPLALGPQPWGCSPVAKPGSWCCPSIQSCPGQGDAADTAQPSSSGALGLSSRGQRLTCFSLNLPFSLLVAFFPMVIFQARSEKVWAVTRGCGAAACPQLSRCAVAIVPLFTRPHLRSLLYFFFNSALWLCFIPIFGYLEQFWTLLSHL